jgi:hypothetical protein
MRLSAKNAPALEIAFTEHSRRLPHLQVLSEDGQVDAIRDASGETPCRRCRIDATIPPDLPQLRPRRGGRAPAVQR